MKNMQSMLRGEPLQSSTWQHPKVETKPKFTTKKQGSHEVQQEEGPYIWEQTDNIRNFDLVNIRYLNFESVRSVIFTKLESSTSQQRNQITYKINTESDGNLIPFRVFKTLFPKSTIADLHATKNSSVMLKTYNEPNI